MAVTANQIMTGSRDPHRLISVPVAASQHIYENTLVFLNAAGFAVTAIAAATFWGIAKHEVDNSSGAAGDLTAEVYQAGVFEIPMSGVADTDRGLACEGVDNFAVQVLAAAARVGTIVNAPRTGIAEIAIDVQV